MEQPQLLQIFSIGNLWFIIKRDAYKNGKQYSSEHLLEAIRTAVTKV